MSALQHTTATQRIKYWLSQHQYLTLSALDQKPIYVQVSKAIDTAFSNLTYYNQLDPGSIKTALQFKKALTKELEAQLIPIVQHYANTGPYSGKVGVEVLVRDSGTLGFFGQHVIDDTHDKSIVSTITVTVDSTIVGSTLTKFLKFYRNSEDYIHQLANVFTHEVIHLIQSSNIPPEHKEAAREHTRVPPTVKSKAQYIGSTKELGAHAAMVASDLLKHSSPEEALVKLTGYFKYPQTIPEGSTLSACWTFLNNNKDRGRDKPVSLNPTQLTWQEFCKKVYLYIKQTETKDLAGYRPKLPKDLAP